MSCVYCDNLTDMNYNGPNKIMFLHFYLLYYTILYYTILWDFVLVETEDVFCKAESDLFKY